MQKLKDQDGKTTKLQDKQLAFLKSLDCYVMVIDSVEDIPIFLGGLELWETQKQKRH